MTIQNIFLNALFNMCIGIIKQNRILNFHLEKSLQIFLDRDDN